jgi:hypothetical protein
MLADGNAVYGFKGLMTFEEFKAELKKAGKRFGSLDKLSVVMHFRISTHGSVIGGNTHPFPLKGGYREMRKTEWVADQGFAHNGIIYQTSKDADIKKHNVSDTMVFAKKYINPIAKYANIASDTAIMDMLFELADSKLCFLTKKGKLATRGNFIERDGVLYSNTSFEEDKLLKYWNAGWDVSGYDWGNISAYPSYKPSFRLNDYDMNQFIEELASDYGYYPVPSGSVVYFYDKTSYYCTDEYELFFDDAGHIYRFDDKAYEFYLWATADEYDELMLEFEEDKDEQS